MKYPDYTLVKEQALSEVNGIVRLWRHILTGAEIVSVLNNDENKCFGVAFRTPPSDSTGVPHILEHSVLCGSEKYHAKEPFVTLLKSSLQTFLNAFTFPDKTCYPVASANLQDFRNLVDVYLDAVFFPRISENTFRQEGWHLEPLDGKDTQKMCLKGVVFNEMKGVYSSPDSLLAEKSQQSLFENHIYGLDSGGNPQNIPSLTYEQFVDFHKKYYHPSNARIFFWGDDPEEGRFEMLNPYLSRFNKGETAPEIPLIKPLAEPRLVEVPYIASSNDDKAHLTMNWLLTESSDVRSMLMLEALNHILIGLAGSPLRKALIESGLGDDIAGNGLELDLRQAYFSVGLRSIASADAPKVETLIMDTLADIAENGISQDAVNAAMNSLEFSLRENNTGHFPRGLSAMLTCLEGWLHGKDPVSMLSWEKELADLKKSLSSHKYIFEDAIRKYFLQSAPVTVLLLPDTTLAQHMEDDEHTLVENMLQSMNENERLDIARIAEELHIEQETPDSPEDIAAIPTLTISGLPSENSLIPSEWEDINGTPSFIHDLPTNGVVYTSLLLPLDAVPDDLIPLLPLYSRALTELGTKHHSFVDFGTQIAGKTGGLAAGSLFSTHTSTKETIAHTLVSGKATVEHVPDLFDLMQEMLTEAHFDNRERFTLMVAEEIARLEQELIPSGHHTVLSRLASRKSLAGQMLERTSGITYLEFLRSLNNRLVDDWDGVLANLEQIHSLIIRRNGGMFNITSDKTGIKATLQCASRFIGTLPDVKLPPVERHSIFLPHCELLSVPSQVNYVGASGNIYKGGYTWHGSAAVVARHIRMDWLWNQVRVKGGAYGAFFSLDRTTGGYSYVSYRDPNIESTLEAYSGTAQFLKSLSIGKTELEQAVVGAIGDMDTYKLPDAKGRTALVRYLVGESDEMRQQTRDEIFSTTQADFRRFGEALEASSENPSKCILGGITAETYAQKQGWTITKVL